MKRTDMNNKTTFVMMNALLAAAAALSAYGFCISNEKGNHWVLAVIILSAVQPMKKMLTDKQQKLSLAAADAGALLTAAAVIAKVGIFILNIRYASIVFMAAVAVLSIAQIIFCMTGDTEKKTAYSKQ